VNPPSTPRDGDDRSVDVEAAWADIVAHWNADPPPVGTWPASEDTDDDPSEEGGEEAPDALGPAAKDVATPDWGAAPSQGGADAARQAPASEDDDSEGYVPPEPPPLPRGDVFTMLGWTGVLGAPLFFLITALFWRTVPQILIVAAVGAFIAGFVALVLRMPDSRDPDDNDDGAVV
jgi:hypothetical protein